MMARSKKGFASMDVELRRKIASKGGKSVQASGNARRWTSEEARDAGSKGGKAAQIRGTAHRFNSQTAKEAAQAKMRKKRGH
jgi:general stress protein YciG